MSPGSSVECCRCGSTLVKPRRNSLGRTAAFSLAALILYVPANIYPILQMEYHGAYSESTVWDGCVRLFQSGQWLIAGIVFCASILVPLLKLLGLFFLVSTTKVKSPQWKKERTAIYKFIEWIGPWAMLDVFLLAILVGLVRLRASAASRSPRTSIRSPSVSPTVAGGRTNGDGHRNHGASWPRTATSTNRGRSCGTPKSEACWASSKSVADFSIGVDNTVSLVAGDFIL